MDPKQMCQNGHWNGPWLLSMKSRGVSQDESAQGTTEQKWMNVGNYDTFYFTAVPFSEGSLGCCF